MTTLGLSLNNPGDIRKDVNNKWQGQRWPGANASFCQFDTMENGIRAMGIILLNGQLLGEPPRLSLRQHAYHYAPPNENDTEGYIRTLANRSGFDPDTNLDLTELEDLIPVLSAFIAAEQGDHAHEIGMEQIAAGARLALRECGISEIIKSMPA